MNEKKRIKDIIIPSLNETHDLSRNIKNFAVSVAGPEAFDDCSILKILKEGTIVIGSDYVRGNGFDLFKEGLLNYFDLGYFLIIANISDIAAMGATPIGLLTIIRYSDNMTDKEFEMIIKGVNSAVKKYKTQILGGDIGGASDLVLSATALGLCENGYVLTRSGANIGDKLFVSGPIGLASTALVYFRKAKKQGLRLSDAEEKELLESWKKPYAQVEEGKIISKLKLATACQDISDGLLATVNELCAQSSVGAIIFEETLPISPTTIKVADFLKIEPIKLALSISVDFSLLFTIAPKNKMKCKEAFENTDSCLHEIGEITGNTKVELLTSKGDKKPLPGIEWKHQKGEISDLIIGPE